MKRTLSVIVTIAALTTAVMTTGACQRAIFQSRKSSGSILGTWQLALYKYGSGQSYFNDFSKSQSRIKLITETYFTWITIDTTSKKVFESAGGTYSLKGNNYIESIDYGLGMDPYIGNKSNFTIQVEGEMFFLSGSLAGGLKIEEIWQRVK